MQHFKPDSPKPKVFPFREKILEVLEADPDIPNQELMDLMQSQMAEYVEAQRIWELRNYAKDMKVLH